MEQVKVQVLPSGLVDRRNAATFLGLDPKTLANWQLIGKGPESHRVDGRRFYKIDDLRSFVGMAA